MRFEFYDDKAELANQKKPTQPKLSAAAIASAKQADLGKQSDLLERAIEAENVLEMRHRKRIQSHFVDSKNEDMLLEEIRPDDQKSVGELLLLDDDENQVIECDDGDELLI